MPIHKHCIPLLHQNGFLFSARVILADLSTLAKGLVPNVKRDKNNRRVFDAHDIAWIKDLVCLKKCGMCIQEMKD